MRPCLFVLLGLSLAVAAGCRSDPAIPILERQLRLQEDEIYRLRAQLSDLRDCGSVCSERWVDDRGSRRSVEPEAESSRRHRRRSDAPNGVQPPLVEGLSQPTSKPPDSLNAPPPGLPEVPKDIQGPAKPDHWQQRSPGDRGLPDHRSLDHRSLDRRSPQSGERPLPPVPADSEGPILEKSVGGATSRSGRAMLASQLGGSAPLMPSGDSRRVATIVLDRTLTGGVGAETVPGDQGLLVVVEPRDRAGRTVDAPAEMSVVVLDPALEGDAARFARWDFTVAETAALFRRTGATTAIHLTTAWPADPPTHRKLHLFVRYVTADGRKLQADMPIEVALPGDRTARWNRSDRRAERGPPAASQQNESATVRVPHTATRSGNPKSPRPVWSPDRR